MGYYNLAKPEFISEVITTFTNLELSKKDVIRANNFMNITGFQECNRVIGVRVKPPQTSV
jgi:hypothetical protein